MNRVLLAARQNRLDHDEGMGGPPGKVDGFKIVLALPVREFAVDCVGGGMGSEQGALLPAAQRGNLIAGEVEGPVAAAKLRSGIGIAARPSAFLEWNVGAGREKFRIPFRQHTPDEAIHLALVPNLGVPPLSWPNIADQARGSRYRRRQELPCADDSHCWDTRSARYRYRSRKYRRRLPSRPPRIGVSLGTPLSPPP